MVTTASPGKCLVYSYVQERSGLYTQEYGSAHRRCYGAIFASSYSAQTSLSGSTRFRSNHACALAFRRLLLRAACYFAARSCCLVTKAVFSL